MIEAQVSRRDVLKFSALGAAAVALPLERVVRAKSGRRWRPASCRRRTPGNFVVPKDGVKVQGFIAAETASRLLRDQAGAGAGADSDHDLPTTNVFAYTARSPGPTIHARQGRRFVVRQINNLPAHPPQGYVPWTSTHLHGSASLPQFDGYASDITNPGQFKDYVYPNVQDARTLWYHDHGVHHTAENAYMGLAAQYHLHDERRGRACRSPRAIRLPADPRRQDVRRRRPVHVRRHTATTGLWGDVILVNGMPWPKMAVERRMYRFRVLNASISRGYRLQLSNGDADHVIATDGGLMPHRRTTAAAHRHGRALRDRHRLREVQPGHAARAAQPRGAQLHRLRQHRQDHAVRRRPTTVRPPTRATTIPTRLNPGHDGR